MSSFLILTALVATSVLAQDVPLASKHFQYTAIVRSFALIELRSFASCLSAYSLDAALHGRHVGWAAWHTSWLQSLQFDNGRPQLFMPNCYCE